MIKKVYLAGPITHAEGRGTSWRMTATEALEKVGIKAIDPTVIEAKDLTPSALMALDYLLITECDAILANVEVPSWGTAMELQYARLILGLTVVGFTPVEPQSPWLLGNCNYIAKSMDTALAIFAFMNKPKGGATQ